MKKHTVLTMMVWLLVLTGNVAHAAAVTNAPGPTPQWRWQRAYQLTAITSTNGIARAVFFWRPQRLSVCVGEGEILTNTTAVVRAIDPGKGSVTLGTADETVEFHLREYQRVAQPLSDKIVLNFEETDIRTVLLYLGELTGETILPATCVRGQVTLINPQPVTRAQAVEIITALIESCNFKVIHGQKVIKVVPMSHGAVAPTADVARTELQVLPLCYAKADMVVAQLSQIFSMPSMRHAKTLTIGTQTVAIGPVALDCSFMADKAANRIVVLGDVRAMPLVQKIVALLDVAAVTGEGDPVMQTAALAYVTPHDMAALLQTLYAPRIVTATLPGTRLLLYRTDSKYVDKVRRVIERCDSPAQVTRPAHYTVPIGTAAAGVLLGGVTVALVRRRRQ